jgi:hypothetical protein
LRRRRPGGGCLAAFASGARQWTVSFDGNFFSCTLSIVDAKSGDATIQRRGPDDILYKAENVTTASPSCSITSGNAFAGQ